MAKKESNINVLLSRCGSHDQDERYMAFSDLSSLMADGSSTSQGEEVERRVVERVLLGLDDASHDVQSMAVKCLTVLTSTLSSPRLLEISSKLASLLLVLDKVSMADIYSMGLISLIKSVQESMGAGVCHCIVPNLLTGIASKNTSMAEKNLDVLAELLKRFGSHVAAAENARIVHELFSLLTSSSTKASIRKRSTASLSALAGVSSEVLLDNLMTQLISGATSKSSSTSTFLQTLSMICRAVGFRLGRYLSALVPLLVSFCGTANEEIEDNDEREARDELRESCLHALEALVLQCPADITPHLQTILPLALDFLAYDPNFFTEEEEEESGDNADDMDVEEEEEEEDYGNEEDNSWKVRKAAVKVIASIAVSRQDMRE